MFFTWLDEAQRRVLLCRLLLVVFKLMLVICLCGNTDRRDSTVRSGELDVAECGANAEC
jgi:hypothetical protein